MLINKEYANDNGTNVEFVKYTGKYPCLCMGELTLKICGKEYVFGHDGNRFWESGGGVFFSADYSDCHISEGEWIVDCKKIPTQFRKYAAEIEKVINDNVEHGCCGGCA